MLEKHGFDNPLVVNKITTESVRSYLKFRGALLSGPDPDNQIRINCVIAG